MNLQSVSPEVTGAFEDTLKVLLGAVIALAAGPITNAIRDARQRRAVSVAIKAELAELQRQMVLGSCQIGSFLGQLDDATIDWAIGLLESYSGPANHDMSLEGLKRERALEQNARKANAAMMAMQDRGVRVGRHDLPFLTTRLDSLSLCPVDFQRRVLWILSDLRAYNATADTINDYRKMTFDPGIPEPVKRTIIANINGNYKSLYLNGLRIARSIDDLLRQ